LKKVQNLHRRALCRMVPPLGSDRPSCSVASFGGGAQGPLGSARALRVSRLRSNAGPTGGRWENGSQIREPRDLPPKGGRPIDVAESIHELWQIFGAQWIRRHVVYRPNMLNFCCPACRRSKIS